MESKGKVLLIENNAELNAINARALKLRGYKVRQAMTLAAARKQLANHAPDIIMLDVILPDGNGIDFCAEIRDSTDAHILFLSAKSETSTVIRGLEAGGDDYIRKPFHPMELLMRIEAVMRRRGMATTLMLAKGTISMDRITLTAHMNGEDMRLSPKEFSLLFLFAQNECKAIRAEDIYEKVWGQPMADNDSAVKKAVSRLRKKMEGSGYTIDVERGKGYSLERAD